MQSYAEGGLAEGGDINSPQNIEAILARLSDAQLQQAHEAALNRRDINEAQMIEAVIAQRASMRQGTEQMPQGIAPALPEQFADGMEQSMATGGIVAFADKGEVKEMPEKATSSIGDILDSIGVTGGFNALREHFYKSKEGEKRIESAESMYPGVTEALRPTERARRKAAGDTLFKGPQNVKPMTPAEIEAANAQITGNSKPNKSPEASPAAEIVAAPKKPAAKPLDKQYADVKSGPKPSKAQVQSAVEQLAEKQGLSPDIKDDVIANTMKITDELGKKNQPIIDEMKKMVESQKTDVEAMKSQGLSQALAEFGFKMAANASRPGARFLESASSAAPTLAAASAKTQELITASQQNYAKLRMDQTKYEVALQKNDMQTAATMAASIRQGQQQDKLLQFQIAKAKDEMEMENRKLAALTSYQQASLSRHETISSLTREIMQNEGLPYGQALEKAGRLHRPAGYAADVKADTFLATKRAEAVQKAQATPAGTMLALTDPSDPKYPAMKAKFDKEVLRQLDLLTPGAAQQGATAAPTIPPDAFKIETIGK